MARRELLSVPEVAVILGITRQAVLKRIRTGRLEATKIGRNYVVPASALLRDPGDADPVLSEVVSRLAEAYRPERMYLFGSSARGGRSFDGDYDLLLVVPDDASDERLRARLAYEALWGLDAAVDVLVWRRSAFDRRARVPTSLPATVLREGILLRAG
jgi:excisionase family DNA binding protein